MTLVVTISANTAAIAMEALKPPRRLSVKDHVADIKADADRNARRAENDDPDDDEFMVPAPAVSIDLLTTGQQPREQASFHYAQAAYRDLEE